MDTVIFRTRPDERERCYQWTLVRDADAGEDFVVQEQIALGALLSGEPYLRLIRRMTVDEFLVTNQPPAVKHKLQAIVESRSGRT